MAPDPAVRPSAGCGEDPTLERSVSLDGDRTDYLLDLPIDYDNHHAYPLLLAFRGMNVSTEQFRAQLGLPEVLGSAAIVVHANPRNEAVAWDFQRDTQLVDALLAGLTSSACIDLDRIFALGDGAGALFVNLLGCVRGDRVRGIALMSSAPPPPGPCVGSSAVWLLQQTDADPSIVGAGLGNRDFWAGRNGCDVRSATTLDPPQCVDYAGCSPGLPVRYCEQTGTAPPSFVAGATWALFRSL
jgi:polyhydroxybutyrate depolymerase